MAIIQKLTVFKEEKLILYFDGFSNLSPHFFLKKFQFFCFEKKKKDFGESATKKLKSVINAFASLKKLNARKKANSIYKSLELGLEFQTGCNKIRLLEQGVFSERKPFKTGQRVVVKGLHLRYQEFFAKKSEN